VLPNTPGRWQPYPVEYKRGKRKAEQSYFVQLCAQALCLEEMLNTEVPTGALYHGQSRRRQPVTFDAALRNRTIELAAKLHDLIAAGNVPPPEYGPKCKFCSLLPQCVPKLPRSRSARDYVERSVREILEER
jgi:CRISPR-associated exonuclease Cas4